MADLSFTQLAAALPANSLTETADDVTISLKTVMGEASVQLADTKVAEGLSKLLSAASTAQVTYNTANDPDLNSYPAPSFGTPVSDGSGGFQATITHTLNVQAPLDTNEITGQTI